MDELSDEKLMSFVDGELDRRETEKIEKLVQNNPTLGERINIFRKSRQLLKNTYDLPAHEEVPEHLVAGIWEKSDNSSRKRKKGKTDRAGCFLRAKIKSLFKMPSWQPAHVLAFSLTLCVGIGGGWFAAELTTIETKITQTTFSPLMVSTELSSGLENTISGRSFSIDSQDIVITPVTTFVAKNGYYCRQYEIAGKDIDTKNMAPAIGVACRAESGEWITRAVVMPPAPALSPPPGERGFVPAGADNLIGRITSELMAAPPLSITKEKEIIYSEWR